MMGYKICFNGEIWIIIPKLFLFPLLIWSTEILVQNNQGNVYALNGDEGQPDQILG